MPNPYEIITKCQIEILNCELPTIDRLQLEMCLLRVKLALLDNNLNQTKSEKEIRDIYDMICCLCAQDNTTKDIPGIVSRLQHLAKGTKMPSNRVEKK